MFAERRYGRNLYWAAHTIPPGATKTFEVHLTGLLEPGAPYVLDLGMQPVVRPDIVSVSVGVAADAEIERAAGMRIEGDRAVASFPQDRARRFAVRTALDP